MRRLLSLMLVGSTVSAGVRQDVSPLDLLESMKSAMAKRKTLHATIRMQSIPKSGKPFDTHVEIWWDRAHSRLRTELSTPDRPRAYLCMVIDQHGILAHQVEIDEFAQKKTELDAQEMLAEGSVGELLLTAFCGELQGMALQSYGTPSLAAAKENVAGTPCRRLIFGGNQDSELWISTDDALPRKIRGPLTSEMRTEEILALEIDRAIPSDTFEMQPKSGVAPASLDVARASWGNYKQSDLWPKTATSAPNFSAVGLDGTARKFSERRGKPILLVFWFSRHEPGVETVQRAEELVQRLRPELSILLVHHGSRPEPALRAAGERKLRGEVWLATDSPGNSFESYRIASCPVFFLMDANGVIVGATRKLQELEQLLSAH